MNELATTNKVQALSVGKFTVTRTGLILDGEPSWQEWQLFMAGLDGVHSSIAWVIGDACCAIEMQYGDEGIQLTNSFPDFELPRLLQYRWVAEHVEYDTRVSNLSWAHHRLIASLDDEDQEYYLAEAEAEGWTTRELADKLGRGGEKADCPFCGVNSREAYAAIERNTA